MNRFDIISQTHIKKIGIVTSEKIIKLSFNRKIILNEKLENIRKMWEKTSFMLEYKQTDNSCVRLEEEMLHHPINDPIWKISKNTLCSLLKTCINDNHPKIAVIREEGNNGDEEMKAAFMYAGFEVWDVAVQDLINESVNLSMFKGLVFPGINIYLYHMKFLI